ncbi:phage portal protein [Agromyces sp. NPDC058064]|uniref:phage portal protein n=1 Tax=Agromyces sp. NPDC058064 TaxID=3346322 RepID=UPI0036D94CBE
MGSIWSRAFRPTDPGLAEQAIEAKTAQNFGAFARLLGGGLHDPEYPGSSFLSHVEHGYARNELVYACITERATSIPDAPLRVYDALGRKSEPLEDHPVRRLLANPNPLMADVELDELLELHKCLAGNAFWEVVSDRAGRPAELWPLRPDLIKVKRGRNTVSYGYSPDGGGRYVDVDVIHFRMTSPLDPLGGMAPMRAALRGTALDNEATNYVTALLQNHAIPGVAITMGNLEQVLDESTTNRLTEKWKQKFGGKRRGEPAFLQTGMEIKELGSSLKDLEFPDLRTISESRICMSFGVPPILVGAKVGLDRSTFANYKEARASFWEETLIPARKKDARLAMALQRRFAGAGARRVEIRPDWSEVEALRESEQARWERATNAFRAGGITQNDFRREVGMQTVDGGDVFLVPSGVIATRDVSGVTEQVDGTDNPTESTETEGGA